MDSGRWERLRGLFDAAMDLKACERPSFIARSCEGDPEFQRALESLVKHSLETGSSFDQAVVEAIELEASLPTAPALLGRILAHYRVIEKIGEGGMGEVYRAADTRLGRDVAIKILPEAFTRDPERLGRFEREARVLASLNHPNIATIHGLEEAEDVRFLVLELIKGVTLRSRLAEGALPLEVLVRLGAQVAAGLAKAHEAGVVHRDLKPENLVLTGEGGIKILDFGLAKAAAGPGNRVPPQADLKTATGRIMGTASYMSPEQARGEAVDYRSDQFSFGAVLHEMATGTRAFSGDTDADILVAVMRQEPERPESFDARVPPPLRCLMERCLAKDRLDRYDSTRDLERDLSGLAERLREIDEPADPPRATASGSARMMDTPPPKEARHRRRVAAMGGLEAARQHAPAAPTGPDLDPNRVAIVPFDNRTGEHDMDVISFLITDWLNQGMHEAAELTFVTSPRAVSPARQMGGWPGPLVEVAREVGAGTVVAGAYYQQGDRLLIQAEMVSVATGQSLPVGPVSGPISEPMSVVEPLRLRVLGLLAGHDPLDSHYTPPTFEAYLEYIDGRELWIEQPATALEHFQRSMELDPGFFEPRLYSVHALRDLGREDEAWAVLDELGDRRGELSSYERLSLDAVQLYTERRYSEALPLLREVVARDPLNPLVRSDHAQVALWTNHPQETVTTLEALADRHKLQYPQLHTLCEALHLLGKHERELEMARTARNEFASQPLLVHSEAQALAALGRVDELGELVEASISSAEVHHVRLAGVASTELRAHGYPEAATGLAERSIGRLSPESTQLPVVRLFLGVLMLVTNRSDEALALYRDLAASFPEDLFFVGAYGATAALLGHRQTALQVSQRLDELTDPQWFGADHYLRANLAAGLGKREEAVEYLHATLRAGFQYHPNFHRLYFLEPLWGYEPFEEFLRPKG